MSRRLRPPKPPVTGHPAVDNRLRAGWKEHLIWVDSRGLGNLPWLPRKWKKFSRMNFYKAGFIYHAPAYYVPAFLREIGATHEQD